jgi:hypothetical protein
MQERKQIKIYELKTVDSLNILTWNQNRLPSNA